MQFLLIDRITELVPGEQISAVKSLSLAEEYLADHFPSFPVMPGVLMLEAMTQASAWLIRASEDFAHSMVVLKEVKNVKYGHFVEPGQTLEVIAKIESHDELQTAVTAQGSVNGKISVRAKLLLERYNLADVNAAMQVTDHNLIEDQKRQLAIIWRDK